MLVKGAPEWEAIDWLLQNESKRNEYHYHGLSYVIC